MTTKKPPTRKRKGTDADRRKLAEQLVTDLRDMRADKKSLEESISGVQAEAMQTIRGMKVKSIGFADPYDEDNRINASIVEPTSLVFDEDKLRKKVGASTWNRISKRVLDTKLLETAVAEGLITPQVAASCATEVPKSPYIRVTQKSD